jgi:hypothetical protein
MTFLNLVLQRRKDAGFGTEPRMITDTGYFFFQEKKQLERIDTLMSFSSAQSRTGKSFCIVATIRRASTPRIFALERKPKTTLKQGSAGGTTTGWITGTAV